ncbi:MAG: ABC transporter ATP-binding protein [Lachnospiraceae bacterium]|jgi:ABC-2 type transport system ATP-binding protein
METAVEVKGLVKHYTGFTLDKIDLTIPTGCIMGLVGENGAGKSTLIKCILGLVFQDSGSVQIYGKEAETLSPQWRNDLGVVMDECKYPQNATALHISKVMQQVYQSWDQEKYIRLLERFHIQEKKVIKEYSKGMKMKLQIAVAMSHGARLLFFDEATSGLDPIVRDEILDMMMEFIQDEQCTLLFSTHITSDLEKVADYITFLHQGKVVFTESKDQLLYDYGVVRCTREDYEKIDARHVRGVRKNSFNYEVLIDNREVFAELHQEMVVDRASIEEIMLLIVKGEEV